MLWAKAVNLCFLSVPSKKEEARASKIEEAGASNKEYQCPYQRVEK